VAIGILALGAKMARFVSKRRDIHAH
jgi:hypothetical protein